MSRGRKLLIVSVVLATGFGLAWPFRKHKPARNFDSVAESAPAPAPQEVTTAVRQPSEPPPTQLGAPTPHVAAKMASMAESHRSASNEPAPATFDLANHPALANSSLAPAASRVTDVSPVTPAVPPVVVAAQPQQTPAYSPRPQQQARPAYPTAERDQAFNAQPQRREIRHVVQNSDTLEKLAKRYLGDEGRALEIFDLNRDVLDNPHLLPIDAELRIPSDAKITLD